MASIIYGASDRRLFDIDIVTNSRGLKIIQKHYQNYIIPEKVVKQRDDLKNFDVDLLALKIGNVLVDIAEDKSAYMVTGEERKKIPIVLNDAKTIIFADLKLKVRPPEELIVQKLYIGRESDIKDAKSILSNNAIDTDYLKERATKINIWNFLKEKLKIID